MSSPAPDANQALRRAMVMSAVCCRASIEQVPDSGGLHEMRLDLSKWVESTGVESAAEGWERAILHSPVGSIDRSDIIRATWAVEGVAVLAWALGVHQLPRYDEKVDPYSVTGSLGLLNEEAVVAKPKLRNANEIAVLRELLYAIHSRVRQVLHCRQPANFKSWLDIRWLDALGMRFDDVCAGDDLAFQGVPIYQQKQELVENGEWWLNERHRAAIWLVNGGLYSGIRVDT